jgi:hypothetical protein
MGLDKPNIQPAGLVGQPSEEVVDNQVLIID